MKYILIFIKYLFILLIVILLLIFIYSWYLKSAKVPKKTADWEFGQGKTAKVIARGENIEIKNLRDFAWEKKTGEEKKVWKDFTFKKSDIIGLKMGVSHFSAKSWIAHVFAIFTLKDGQNFAVSIESRREKGEKFDLIKGLSYDYELIYILATEKDLLDLRKIRNEKIYIYPIKTTPEHAQKLFTQISEKINSLNEKPEFYHLFAKNCTNSIANEVEKFSDKSFPFIEKTFLPGNSAQALFKMGLIDSEKKNFEEMQKDFLLKFE